MPYMNGPGIRTKLNGQRPVEKAVSFRGAEPRKGEIRDRRFRGSNRRLTNRSQAYIIIDLLSMDGSMQKKAVKERFTSIKIGR